jgi:predicted GNAT family acetyltransferase
VQLDDPADFRARALPLLLADEAANNLPIGLLGDVPEGELRVAFKALVEDDAGAPRLMLLRTPPFPLLTTDGPDAAIDCAAAALGDELVASLTGVNGPERAARRLAAAIAARAGRTVGEHLRLAFYELTRVIPARAPSGGGALRPGTLADLALAAAWWGAFQAEADVQPRDPEKLAAADLAAGRLYFWRTGDGTDVALAGARGRTPTGVRIGPVYTPPALRRRGYGSAAVAALSQRLLDAGLARCCLFADRKNSTSNAIYQAIGYRERGDFVELTLG